MSTCPKCRGTSFQVGRRGVSCLTCGAVIVKHAEPTQPRTPHDSAVPTTEDE